MLEILKMLGIGFFVGLTGALVPGPMLFATMETSLTRGWLSGPKVVSGHALIEILVFVLIISGFSTRAARGAIPWISMIGGAVLVMFGVMTIRQGRHASLSRGTSVFRSPFAAGMVTSLSHPYFWLWWLTAGAGLVLTGLEISLTAALIFMVGHVAADLGWYTLVATANHRTGSFMKSCPNDWSTVTGVPYHNLDTGGPVMILPVTWRFGIAIIFTNIYFIIL